ncbi:MAG: response regulator transcription factor [Chloroflexota bacterium]
MANGVRILIADDHPLVRLGLKTLLEHKGHLKVVAEATTGEEAIQKAQETQPDVAVLDIRMPGLTGIEACRQIIQSVAGCKVILLTAYAEDELLFAAIRAGAAGYVLKRVGDNDLLQAIERVSQGEGILDPSMTATVFAELRKAAQAQYTTEFTSLTVQEISVLVLVTKGFTNRHIAADLYLGEGTIRNYVSSILAKLKVTNRAAAAAYGVKHHLEGFTPDL